MLVRILEHPFRSPHPNRSRDGAPSRRLRLCLPFLTVTLLIIPAIAQPSEDPLLGFKASDSARQRELEAQFDSHLTRDNLRQWMKRLSARPHHVGSSFGREVTQFIASKFRSWGYETHIEEFRVLFPTPRLRRLEMVEPTAFKASLIEPVLEQDSTSDQQDEQLPTYNAYSIDGDVTGELVYVNYGVPEDYLELKKQGIEVRGRIVIARYGGAWRGIKPKVAAEHGAIGCVIYSDPRDDGYFQGDVYPQGPYKNQMGVQRGSVLDMPLFPGDPLTPGVGAVADAARLSIDEAPTLTKIPVLPISYHEAQPFLSSLAGPVAPESWRGALPITYHLGPGPAKVRLQVEFNWDLTPARNVIAKLEGTEHPKQWIIRGNHHDAWVNGAEDPVSGMVAMMEEARAIGELASAGWRPKRTILYAAWDAEEPGLLGSTEWVETHAEQLRENAAVYINSDSNGRGFLRAGGSHTLQRFLNQVARSVTDPQKDIAVSERLRALQMVTGNPREQREAEEHAELRIAALGSGSDYTPFLQHLGIASLNIGFGGEDLGGSYHSIYDSFDHYTRFVDPQFDYGIALAQTCGRAVLRLADADLLPFEFGAFADTISVYIQEVIELEEEMRKETRKTNKLIDEGRLETISDPTLPYVSPSKEPPVPHLTFAPLQNALDRIKTSGEEYERLLKKFALSGDPLSMPRKRALDRILLGTERALTHREGLPERPWFKHFVYAPGFYTGYGVKTLPAVREAIEQRKWDLVDSAVERTAGVLVRFADRIDQAIQVFSEEWAED